MLDDEDTSFSLGFLSFSEPQRGLVACNDVTREVESTRGEEESSERAREREEKRENASESEFSSSFSVSLFHRPSFSALSLAAPPPPNFYFFSLPHFTASESRLASGRRM